MRSESRTRLSLVLLVYFLAVVGVINLAPFRFAASPDVAHVFAVGDPRDLALDFVLFFPLGFVFPLTRTAEDTPAVKVLIAALLASTSIEMAKLFEPEAFGSLLDVLCNVAGAVAGAAVLRNVTRRIRVSALVGRLSLEIPLIGLIYLLVPLLLVASVAPLDHGEELVAFIPLGLLAVKLMSAVQRYHFGPARVFRDRSMGLYAGALVAVGTLPALLRFPVTGLCFAVAVGLMTWYESSVPVEGGTERRFEAETLRSALPYTVAYFAAVALTPLLFGVSGWHSGVPLTGSDGVPAQQMIRALQPAASLTLLGYMIAEARGRGERLFRVVVWRLAAECGCVALLLEASRGFQSAAGGSGMELGAMVFAGLLGGAIYHKQRQNVRWILIHRGSAPAPTISAVGRVVRDTPMFGQPALAMPAQKSLSRFSELSGS